MAAKVRDAAVLALRKTYSLKRRWQCTHSCITEDRGRRLPSRAVFKIGALARLERTIRASGVSFFLRTFARKTGPSSAQEELGDELGTSEQRLGWGLAHGLECGLERLSLDQLGVE